MEDGESEREAREKCEADLLKRKRTGEPEYVAADSSLGIVGREATPLERCMGCRIDIYGEDEETARKTCTKMFNDPMCKHAFTEGDSIKMGEVLHNWDLAHNPKWFWWREKHATKDVQREKAIDKIVEELQHSNTEDHFLPAVSLREKAEIIYDARKEKAEADVKREEKQSRLTVGDLFNKTKEQRIRDQHKPGKKRLTAGDQFGKTRAQICAEIGEDLKIEDKLRKLKRKEGKE